MEASTSYRHAGYGPARRFPSVEVRELASRLEPISGDALWVRYDGAAMDVLQIYPSVDGGWAALDVDGASYFVDYYEALRALVLGAAEQSEALLVFLN